MTDLPDLDEASLLAMRVVARLAGVKEGRRGTQVCALIQITIREAMRAALPPDDPRRDTNWPFNQTGA